MRVKKIHPLCSISLESPGIGDQSPEVSRAVTAASSGGSDGNAGRQVGSDINVAGVLYKWTNYGKGWRFWWFLLRSGVLSYSQIRHSKSLHLPLPADDIRVIGDVPTNRLSRLDSGGGRRKHRKMLARSGPDISGQLTKQKTERDPRRLDPRRVGVPIGLQSVHMMEDIRAIQVEFDGPFLL